MSGILVPLCASLKVWHIENHPIVYLALLGSAVAVVSALLRDGDAVSIGKMQVGAQITDRQNMSNHLWRLSW